MQKENLPLGWKDWDRQARVAWLSLHYTRADLIKIILTDISADVEREITPESRLKRKELAGICCLILDS